jgi:hypothetical protein
LLDIQGKVLKIISGSEYYAPRFLESKDEIALVRIKGKGIVWAIITH